MHAVEAMVGQGAWLAQLSALLLVLAMFNRATLRLRLWVMAAALAGIGYALLVRRPPLTVWPGALLLVNLIQIARIEVRERRQRFTPPEEALRGSVLTGLSRWRARTLIDQGDWVHGRAGERLLTEGQPAGHLFFVHDGAAAVSLGGVPVGNCGPGELIGDATALSGTPATATVTLSGPSLMWCIAAPHLREYLELHPEVRAVLDRRINDSLKAKLASANRRLVEVAR